MTKHNLSPEEYLLEAKKHFMSHVHFPDDLNDCWIWIRSKNTSGYGQFSIKHKPRPAHRVSFELFVGPIPDGLFVCHSCDNKLCVNPSHLFLGTQQDNMDDKVSKNRQSHSTNNRGENHGKHKLTEQDIYQIREMSKQGYTSREVADMFGVSQQTVCNILSGKRWGWLK